MRSESAFLAYGEEGVGQVASAIMLWLVVTWWVGRRIRAGRNEIRKMSEKDQQIKQARHPHGADLLATADGPQSTGELPRQEMPLLYIERYNNKWWRFRCTIEYNSKLWTKYDSVRYDWKATECGRLRMRDAGKQLLRKKVPFWTLVRLARNLKPDHLTHASDRKGYPLDRIWGDEGMMHVRNTTIGRRAEL